MTARTKHRSYYKMVEALLLFGWMAGPTAVNGWSSPSRRPAVVTCTSINTVAKPRRSFTTLFNRVKETRLQQSTLSEIYRNEEAPTSTSSKHNRIWMTPPALSLTAFLSYTQTSQSFHSTLDTLSGHTWMGGDSEAMQPILNGPVALSVSILLGTLVAMTIQTLYHQNNDTFRALIGDIEERREFNVILETFPEPHKTQCQTLLNRGMQEYTTLLKEGVLDVTTARLMTNDLAELRFVLQTLSHQKDSPEYIGEALGCCNNLKTIRADLIASIQTTFSPGHYGNIMILAFSVLFIFLLETGAMVDFPLSICWALLVGSFSMMFAVIYDLRFGQMAAIQQAMEGANQNGTITRNNATLKMVDNKAADDTESNMEELTEEKLTTIPTTVAAKEASSTIELTDETIKQVLINELHWKKQEVKLMRPDMAAIAVHKKLMRPRAGMPDTWYAGSSKDSAIEITDEIMKQVLVNELHWKKKEVRHMRPDIAAIAFHNKLMRPRAGMPVTWCV